jgi:hypothetical protein
MFWCVSIYLGSFGTVCLHYETRAKQTEQVQKFLPRSRVRVFATNAPDPPHWTLNEKFSCVSYYLGVFGTVWLPYETQCKTCRISGNVRATKSRRNFPELTHPIHSIGPKTKNLGLFRTIWVHLEPFGCITKLGAKWAEIVQKFVPRIRVGIFRKERTRFTPLDPKLMFWYVSYYLGAFGTVWLPYGTRCKTGRTSAKVRAMKSHRNFSQRTHPIHPIRP